MKIVKFIFFVVFTLVEYEGAYLNGYHNAAKHVAAVADKGAERDSMVCQFRVHEALSDDWANTLAGWKHP